jgi:elongation factor Ts
MATITASMVNELRAKTGLAMMECKKILVEVEGDIEKAIDVIRKKGVKTSITERAATEGRVLAITSPDNKTAAIVEVNCNTDFTAKSEPVLKLLESAAAKLLKNPTANLADDAEVKASLAEVSKVTGENVILGRNATLTGDAVGSYLYSTAGKGKIGVIVSITNSLPEGLVNQLGMHIAAARPIAHKREDVAPEIVAKEREIAVEQAKATGKPQAIAEKIAEGKLNAFYSEKVLLDQDYINADAFKGKVSDLLKSKGAILERYVRIEVGQ